MFCRNLSCAHFSFRGHSVLPDIHASLYYQSKFKTSSHDQTTVRIQSAMAKGFSFSYSVIFPIYLLLCVLAYQAFGSSMLSFLLDSLTPVLSEGCITAIYVLLLINTLSVGCVYIQASFMLLNTIFPCLNKNRNQSCRDNVVNRSSNQFKYYSYKQLLARFVFIASSTFVAVALPFFGYLASLSGAVCLTPLTVSTKQNRPIISYCFCLQDE